MYRSRPSAARMTISSSALFFLGSLVALVVLGVIVVINGNKIDSLEPLLATITVNGSCPDNNAVARKTAAYQHRLTNSLAQFIRPVQCHENNGDEVLYAVQGHFASYSKGLQHDSLGHVLNGPFGALVHACSLAPPGEGTGLSSDFDAIPLAGGSVRRLTNPQASLAFVNEGGDPASFNIVPAPEFSSAAHAADVVENYWMALLRDVPFESFSTDPLALQAVADLNSLGDFRGPGPSGQNLFRDTSAGSLVGPYISQFMWLPYQFGAHSMHQHQYSPVPGVDFMTNWTEYLAIQNGAAPSVAQTFQTTPVYIRNGRDLSHYVHIDVLFQAYFEAALCLLNMGAPLKSSLPYQLTSLNQAGFGTFGGPVVAQLPSVGAIHALKTAWFHKWRVNRRLRPEVAAARVDRHLNGHYVYPLHADLLASSVLQLVNDTWGSYLLPQAYPEGSPTHPSYPAGHATVAATAVTMLKAFFDESWAIPAPVVASLNGTVLLPYVGPPLTVGHELDKLAANVGIGRNWAGVHYRSDAIVSFKLGEQIAVEILKDWKNTFNEPFEGFRFTNMEGTLVIV
jgi:membrane-associated phospholipid phosphatase